MSLLKTCACKCVFLCECVGWSDLSFSNSSAFGRPVMLWDFSHLRGHHSSLYCYPHFVFRSYVWYLNSYYCVYFSWWVFECVHVRSHVLVLFLSLSLPFFFFKSLRLKNRRQQLFGSSRKFIVPLHFSWRSPCHLCLLLRWLQPL